MTDAFPLDDLSDDQITVFQLEGRHIRGRALRMGEALDRALKTPDGQDRYPTTVARLLGEAMMLSALVARSLKFNGRLVIQCVGTNDGAVSLLMADCTTEGHLRGYARFDKDMLRQIELDSRQPGAETLMGGGTFSMTIDQGPDMDSYQGLAAIEGARLSDCAEHYYAQSEQVPTELRLACGQVVTESGSHWRGGGMMIQRVAEDQARGDTKQAWDTARSLFGTLSDAELIDPDLTQNRLLFRLFHEDGVRIVETHSVTAQCRCSRDRLENTLRSFDPAEVADMADDGQITANCEFCGADYVFEISALTPAKTQA